jgi:hypothetical protein
MYAIFQELCCGPAPFWGQTPSPNVTSEHRYFPNLAHRWNACINGGARIIGIFCNELFFAGQ